MRGPGDIPRFSLEGLDIIMDTNILGNSTITLIKKFNNLVSISKRIEVFY